MTFLSAEPFYFRNRHACDPRRGEPLLNLIELERLNDRFDLFHGIPLSNKSGAAPFYYGHGLNSV
jgi:hypothetical protein